MRGQLVAVATQTGKLILALLMIFVVIGAIVGAGLIDNTNPFYDVWQTVLKYAGIVFSLVAIGVLFLLWKLYQAYM